ncbi:PREDICTED: uncharacterized protein K02A2.6-like [Papilio xuthus]|uniref:RNA-directed DNA polymerase n=1 Tax=Papilio xuthus TaxID=66420 RepID=A0AAJ7ECT3_PAPXU|nr:PREDICTED: uncharacterized protein K02A2.6-like [Papilio xuthus]
MPFGKLHEYDINDRNNWSAYVRLVKQFILLNDIREDLHVATLLTHVGAATYELMCDLCAPMHPETKSFQVLVDLVGNHLEPKRSEIAERHLFRQRRQTETESISVFLQNLKHLAKHCNFGTMLEENIRDQFVSGLRNEVMRSRLFAEPTLDYKKAVELALALEAAERHAEAAGGDGQVTAPAASGLEQAGGLHRVAAGATRPRRNVCWRCGKDEHTADKCSYKSFKCYKCYNIGHLAKMCKKNVYRAESGKSKLHNYIDSCDSASDASDCLHHIISVSNNGTDGPYHCSLRVENIDMIFEIDTGSRISAVSKEFYDKYFYNLPITKHNIKLQSYTGEAIVPLGYVTVRVTSGSGTTELPLFVIARGGPPLLGRVWLRKLNLDAININKIGLPADSLLINLRNEFPEVFGNGVGTFKIKIKLHLKDTTPIFCKARPLPLALRSPVERELERLQAEGIIYKVDRSDYGTPIVPIIKRDGTIRICGDYKVTVNPLLKDFHYPLPRTEELFAALSGGEQFTKLDLKNAYLQVVLDEASQPLTAITTHMGVFVYRRAPFGLKCLPEMFQKLIEETLSGLDCVVAFIDDICITGRNREHHLQNVKEVLSRLKEAGLRIKFEKCEFFMDEISYLGYRIDKNGVHTDKSKVSAIVNLPVPKNVSQLRAALGLINYYSRFIPNMSTLLNPLYKLLAKGNKWCWNRDCERAFKAVKDKLVSGPALAHYSPSLPLVLAVDSSAYGLGAVLAHRMPDGSERIVSCASRTLTDTERRYSQIDKEALAIVYGVSRHHQYLFGRKFTLRSDHKALTYIFGPKHGIPQTAASRLQRYAVRLAAYDFDIVFVSTDKNGNADGLSRLPQPTSSKSTEEEDAATYLHFVEDSFPLSHKDVAKETAKDVTLRKIYGYIISGWPQQTEIEGEKPYFHRKEELHVDHGCIVWGYRVVIPGTLRKQIVEEVHAGHVGMVRMKQIARSYVWWPRLDAELEERARTCAACRDQRDAPPCATPVPYAWPSEPWTRLHADFLQHGGRYYLLVIDAHSKWIEVFHMCGGTSAATVENKFRELFARFGIPRQMVTDGGPPFTSCEFEEFLKKNGVDHIVTAPYHPSSNGAAENAVKTVKKVIKKAQVEGENVDRALSKFLMQYRNSTHCTTQREPAVAMLGRRLRTRLDLLRPAAATGEAVARAQCTQLRHAGGRPRSLGVGDVVLVRNYGKGDKWMEGIVTERTGKVTYAVNTGDKTKTRHIDQIIPKKNLRHSWHIPIQNENSEDNECSQVQGDDTAETRVPAARESVNSSSTSKTDEISCASSYETNIVPELSIPTQTPEQKRYNLRPRQLKK